MWPAKVHEGVAAIACDIERLLGLPAFRSLRQMSPTCMSVRPVGEMALLFSYGGRWREDDLAKRDNTTIHAVENVTKLQRW